MCPPTAFHVDGLDNNIKRLLFLVASRRDFGEGASPGGRAYYIQEAIREGLAKNVGYYPKTGHVKFKLTSCGKRVAKYLVEREGLANYQLIDADYNSETCPLKNNNPVTSALEEFIQQEQCSPYEINNGLCIDAAEYVEKKVPDARELTLRSDSVLPGHAWIYFQGKHYDVEALEGVNSFLELPIFKKFLAASPNIILDDWTASMVQSFKPATPSKEYHYYEHWNENPSDLSKTHVSRVFCHGTTSSDLIDIYLGEFHPSLSGFGQSGLSGIGFLLDMKTAWLYAKAKARIDNSNPTVLIIGVPEGSWADLRGMDLPMDVYKAHAYDSGVTPDDPVVWKQWFSQYSSSQHPYPLTSVLQEMGYDGAIIDSTLEHGGADEYIWFDNTSVKIVDSLSRKKRRRNPYRRNSDGDIQQLRRDALSGDRATQIQLGRELIRSGQYPNSMQEFADWLLAHHPEGLSAGTGDTNPTLDYVYGQQWFLKPLRNLISHHIDNEPVDISAQAVGNLTVEVENNTPYQIVLNTTFMADSEAHGEEEASLIGFALHDLEKELSELPFLELGYPEAKKAIELKDDEWYEEMEWEDDFDEGGSDDPPGDMKATYTASLGIHHLLGVFSESKITYNELLESIDQIPNKKNFRRNPSKQQKIKTWNSVKESTEPRILEWINGRIENQKPITYRLISRLVTDYAERYKVPSQWAWDHLQECGIKNILIQGPTHLDQYPSKDSCLRPTADWMWRRRDLYPDE